MSSQDNIDNRQTAEHGGLIMNTINKPLPWIVILALLIMYDSVQSFLSKQAAFDAQTQCMLVADHVRDLRESMAAHGVQPLPTFPKELK